MNKMLFVTFGILKRCFILIIPMFLIGMLYIDVGIAAKYENVTNFYILTVACLAFYAACIWCILLSFKPWCTASVLILGIAICLITRYNEEIYHNWQLAKCIDASKTFCN